MISARWPRSSISSVVCSRLFGIMTWLRFWCTEVVSDALSSSLIVRAFTTTSNPVLASASALVNRMNDALALASGRLPGVRISNPPPPESVLAGNISETTQATIAKAASPPQALALALGSPEFQRR